MNECEQMNNIERWTAVVFGRGCERCVKGSAESSKLTGESPELVRAANQVVERGGQRWRGAKMPQKQDCVNWLQEQLEPVAGGNFVVFSGR